MANTRLDRTNGSPTNGQKGTFSTWVRVDKVAAQKIMINYLNSENYSYIRFHPSKFLQCYATLSNSVVNNYKTKRYFVDFNGWYHIVVRIDTTQANATDRLRLYINGELQTQYDTYTYSGSQNAQHPILIASATNTHRIGADENPADYFSGLMSHFHFCDGYSYDASAFGSTDATTGEWKINTSPSVTYGNNGYFILKDGNSVTDQSGNSNNFTVTGGTLTKTESSPSNVFATFNPLMKNSNINLQNGNTSIRPQANSIDFQAGSTLAFSSGKYYAEFKYLENDGHQMYGISTTEGASELLRNLQFTGQTATSVAIYASNGSVYENNSASSYGSGFANNAIIMMAVDADNNKIYFGSNGTWYNSGNPSSGTNGYSFNATNLAGFKYMVAGNGTVGYDNTDANFGNGYFGTTAVSSAGTNASNNGIFEYDVPTGYTALSTKGLNL